MHADKPMSPSPYFASSSLSILGLRQKPSMYANDDSLTRL